MPILNTACGPCYQAAMNWRTAVENSNKIVLEDGSTLGVTASEEQEEVPLEDMSAKERFDYFLQNTGCDELIIAFVEVVNERAMDLMLSDGKVEGKHYAAMKLILKEVGIEHNLK